MNHPHELIQALAPVVSELDRLGVRYCVGGSVASAFHGAARSTVNVDLVAELDQAAVTSLIQALQHDYYIPEKAAYDAVRSHSCFNLLHLATSFKIDIFVSRDREFDRRVQERAMVEVLGDVQPLSTRISSAEDIILAKLEWYRLGNESSERQWNDITVVAKLQGSRLDRNYLRHGAQELGVADLLEQLWSEVESGGG